MIYHLFLDESEVHKGASSDLHFCIAGVAIEEGQYETTIKQEVNNIKKEIWADFTNPENLILHEKDIRSAKKSGIKGLSSEYHRFRANQYQRKLYTKLNTLISSHDLTIFGASVSLQKFDDLFGNAKTDKYLLCLQIILENYVHFLHNNNSSGFVHYEHVDDSHDKMIRNHFSKIKALGTMYINHISMQERLHTICFPSKNANICGLQIADFVPNGFARKHLGLSVHKFNIQDILEAKMYKGNAGFSNVRFSVKQLP